VPWAMPSAAIDAFLLAYPSRRYRSAWFGIIVHSSQTLVVSLIVLTYVL